MVPYRAQYNTTVVFQKIGDGWKVLFCILEEGEREREILKWYLKELDIPQLLHFEGIWKVLFCIQYPWATVPSEIAVHDSEDFGGFIACLLRSNFNWWPGASAASRTNRAFRVAQQRE